MSAVPSVLTEATRKEHVLPQAVLPQAVLPQAVLQRPRTELTARQMAMRAPRCSAGSNSSESPVSTPNVSIDYSPNSFKQAAWSLESSLLASPLSLLASPLSRCMRSPPLVDANGSPLLPGEVKVGSAGSAMSMASISKVSPFRKSVDASKTSPKVHLRAANAASASGWQTDVRRNSRGRSKAKSSLEGTPVHIS